MPFQPLQNKLQFEAQPKAFSLNLQDGTCSDVFKVLQAINWLYCAACPSITKKSQTSYHILSVTIQVVEVSLQD